MFSNEPSRELFINLIIFRLAGHHSFRINASFNSLVAEQERYAKVAAPIPSNLALRGALGDLLHYDFVFDNHQYKIDCLGLDYYLVRKQYFYDVDGLRIAPELGDWVVDGGACLGDTAAVFSNAVGSQGQVFAFDPIADHLDVLQHNIEQFPLKNVVAVPCGLSDGCVDGEPLRLNAYEAGFQARGRTLPMVSIDSLVEKQSISKIEFIKLDVEGSEIAALRGAQRSIWIFQPKLAISLYHKPNDLFEIPKFINTLFPFYSKFTIGHYSIDQGETVLYVSA